MDEEISSAGVRRWEVLDAALRTFARFGYRKTSMDDVAREARISRPGLYFLFSSKSGLFQEAAERAVELDLSAAEAALSASGRPLNDRIVEAFDSWAGRYIGPLHDTAALIENNPDLLGPIALGAPARFEGLLTAALHHEASTADPTIAAQTLISVSIGLKHQATDRDEYRARMLNAVQLVVRSA